MARGGAETKTTQGLSQQTRGRVEKLHSPAVGGFVEKWILFFESKFPARAHGGDGGCFLTRPLEFEALVELTDGHSRLMRLLCTDTT